MKAGDVGTTTCRPDGLQLDVARAMKGKDELVSETRPVPQHAHDHKQFSIAWEGGCNFAEHPGTFALWVSHENSIEIPAISEQSTAWFNADKTVSLKYDRDTTRPEMGLLTLTLPSSRSHRVGRYV